MRFEEHHQFGLFLSERVSLCISFAGRLEHLQKFARGVALEYGGMDVALAADGGSVAKFFGHILDGLYDVPLRLCLGFEGFEFTQGEAGEDGARP